MLRVLGIDPGLTRCGVGVVEVAPNRVAHLVAVTVIRTASTMELPDRLVRAAEALEDLLDTHSPHAVAIERVFAQNNVRTVMGTAQLSGVAIHAAARRKLPVHLHTPSEVKAAITGYGSADKRQVATMVTRILRLEVKPTPADAADALAIAICSAWRYGGASSYPGEGATSPDSRALTPAQAAWRHAERASTRR